MTQFNLSVPSKASLDSSVTFPPKSLVTKTHVGFSAELTNNSQRLLKVNGEFAVNGAGLAFLIPRKRETKKHLQTWR